MGFLSSLSFKNIKSMAIPKKTFVSVGTAIGGYVFNSKVDATLEKVEFLKKLPFLTPTTWASVTIVLAGVMLKQAPIATFGFGGIVRDVKDQYMARN